MSARLAACPILGLLMTSATWAAPTDWPMWGHDASHRARSGVVAAQAPDLNWESAERAFFHSDYEPDIGQFSPVVGADGAVYYADAEGVVALNADGSLRWVHAQEKVSTGVALGRDGTIYAGHADGLMALNPDGGLRWSFDVPGVPLKWPVVRPDGRIVATRAPVERDHERTLGTGTMYVLDEDGHELMRIKVPGGPAAIPAFMSDSSVVVPAVDCIDWDWDDIWYCAVYRPRLYSASPSQDQVKLIFSSPKGGYYARLSSPTIGRGDAIYVAATLSGGARLYRLDPGGSVRWNVPLECCFASMPAIGPGGNVYVETAGGSRPALVHAVSPTGKVRWRTMLADNYYPVHPLAVGADGTIYGGVFKGVLHALSPDGSIRWSSTLDPEADYPAPAIGPDGSVILLESRLDFSDWSYHQKMIAIGPGPAARQRREDVGRSGSQSSARTEPEPEILRVTSRGWPL